MSTDTRTLVPGAVFVALRGERYDGHDFVGEAARAGASLAIVETVPEADPPLPCCEVKSTRDALGRLAWSRRQRLKATVCAIVGSNGKTSTKEMTRAVLESRYRVHATRANENNLIGVARTLLDAPEDADVVVVELGTNAKGEIARAAQVVEPDIVVVTSLSEEHLEGLGDLKGVLAEETSVFAFTNPEGVVIVPRLLTAVADRARALVNDVQLVDTRIGGREMDARYDIRSDGRTRFVRASHEIEIPFCGSVFVSNACLALAVGEAMGIDSSNGALALGRMQPPPLRGDLRRIGSFVVLADCYNANPASVAAAIDTLRELPGRRVAFIGTMDELGKASARLHREVARYVLGAGLDQIVATGAFVEAFAATEGVSNENLILASTVEEGFLQLCASLRGNETILFKASRSTRLEQYLPRLARKGAEPW